tara:strand:- start:782 stop:1240 length:459 start_codon:yes stop_codon:yes gene_type:complete
MTYTPFKLQGHELPGPNQKDPSPAKYTKIAGTGTRYSDLSRDHDPNYMAQSRDDLAFDEHGIAIRRKTGESLEDYAARTEGSGPQNDGRTEGGWDPAARAQARKEAFNQTVSGEQAQYVDSGITDSYGTEVNNQEETKVPVDVEVTVNGQPV